MLVQIGLYLLLCELDLLRWNPWIKLTFLSLQFQNWVINVWKLERRLRIPKKRSHLFSRRDPASSAILHFENLQERGGREWCNVASTENWDILPAEHLREIFATYLVWLIRVLASPLGGWAESPRFDDILCLLASKVTIKNDIQGWFMKKNKAQSINVQAWMKSFKRQT